MEENIEALEEKRKNIIFMIGQKKVHQEILTAELLQHCQEVVNLNNEIAKAKKYATPAPKLANQQAEAVSNA